MKKSSSIDPKRPERATVSVLKSYLVHFENIFLLLIILSILVTLMRYRHCESGEKIGTLRVNHSFKGESQIKWKFGSVVFLGEKITGVRAVKPSWNKIENQQQTKPT